MIRSTALAAASLIIVFVAAAMLLTFQSRAVVAQQDAAHEASSHIANSTFASNNRVNTRLASVTSTTLVRSTYMLPADAAELLTKLFEHKATALVECETDDEAAEDNKGLVKFEITAGARNTEGNRSVYGQSIPS